MFFHPLNSKSNKIFCINTETNFKKPGRLLLGIMARLSENYWFTHGIMCPTHCANWSLHNLMMFTETTLAGYLLLGGLHPPPPPPTTHHDIGKMDWAQPCGPQSPGVCRNDWQLASPWDARSHVLFSSTELISRPVWRRRRLRRGACRHDHQPAGAAGGLPGGQHLKGEQHPLLGGGWGERGRRERDDGHPRGRGQQPGESWAWPRTFRNSRQLTNGKFEAYECVSLYMVRSWTENTIATRKRPTTV